MAVLIGEGFIGTGAARVMSLRIRLTTSPSWTGYSSRSLLSARALPLSKRRTAAGFAGESCDLMERTVSDGDTLRVVEDAGLSDLKVRVIAFICYSDKAPNKMAPTHLMMTIQPLLASAGAVQAAGPISSRFSYTEQSAVRSYLQHRYPLQRILRRLVVVIGIADGLRRYRVQKGRYKCEFSLLSHRGTKSEG